MTNTTRRSLSVLSLVAAAAMTAGCQSHKLVGTWEADKDVPTHDSRVGDFRFGAVTFAPDGTYTAHMIYADRQLGETGDWKTQGDMLEFTNSHRSYRYSLHGNDLNLTDPKTNISLTLHRYR